MKKVLASLVLIGLLAIPTMASAGFLEDILRGLGVGGTAPIQAPQTDVMTILVSLTNWLFAILLVIAAIYIIVAAYTFVTATGDPDKTKKARDFVLYALIGVLVGLAAKGLVSLVERIVEPAVVPF